MFSLFNSGGTLREIRTADPVTLTEFGGKYTVHWTNNEPVGYPQVRIGGGSPVEFSPGTTSWNTAQTNPDIEVRFRVRNRFGGWIGVGI